MPDGSYVTADGTVVGGTVHVANEADGTPHLELTSTETVRRTARLCEHSRIQLNVKR